MKKALRVLGIILLVLLTAAGLYYITIFNARVDYAVNETAFPLSTEQKLEDFRYLFRTLEQNFPYFDVKKRQHGTDWLSMEGEFASRIAETRSDAEFYAVLDEIVTLIQNGHTNIIEPGTMYEEYRRIYSGPTPWSQVYNNCRVREAYAYWDTVVNKSVGMCLPVSFKYLEGEYCAWGNPVDPEGVPEDSGIPSGSRLREIDGVSVDDYITTLMHTYAIRYDRLREKAKVNTLIIRSESPVKLSLETPAGIRMDVVVEPGLPEEYSDEDYEMPDHLFSAFKFEEEGIAYLKLPSFDQFYVDKDAPGIRAFLEEIRDYRSLIIDIRGNGGGSTNYWMNGIVPLLTDKPLSMRCYLLFRDSPYIKPFIKHKFQTGYFQLKDLGRLDAGGYPPDYYFLDGRGLYSEIDYIINPHNPVGFKGRIYLLVDDYVFSSSESFAAFAKSTGWAALIGTDTGGDGIGFDPIPIVLPNSGLIVRFPGEMGLNPDGAVNEEVRTIPDVFVEQTYEDFLIRMQKQDSSDDPYNRMEYDTILRKAFELAGSAQ